MDDKLSKILSIVLYIVLGISGLLAILFYLGAIGEDAIIYWAYILFGGTALVSVIAPVMFFIQNPSKGKITLIGIVAFVILFVIAYLLASNSIEGAVYEKFEVTEGVSQRVGAALILTYILGIGAIVAVIASGFLSMFKK